jgi:hypothetical protein
MNQKPDRAPISDSGHVRSPPSPIHLAAHVHWRSRASISASILIVRYAS